MAATASTPWQPKTILRVVKSLPTATGTVLVDTDQGAGYLKAMGNPEGPHVVACEWVGTELARCLGLTAVEFALIEVTIDDEIPFAKGGKAAPGPAFISRRERGGTWGGKRSLRKVANPAAMTQLVVFDTWTRNCDRYPPDPTKRRPNRDNIFLSREGAPPGRLLLKAIDHGCCFTCGRDLTAQLAEISIVREEGRYGLFPEFWPFLDRQVMRTAIDTLHRLKRIEVQGMVSTVPSAWDVSPTARNALVEFIVGRAAFVCQHIEDWIWPQRDLFPESEDQTP